MILSKKNKIEKAEQKSINKFKNKNIQTPDLLPFIQYKNNCFHMKNGKYVDFLKIICKDVLSLSKEESDEVNYLYEKFYRTYSGDIKLIGINVPVNTTKNKKYINHKIETTNNALQKEFLFEASREQECVQEMLTQREYNIMFFFDSIEEHKENIDKCCRTLGEHFLVDRLTQKEKETIIFKLCNKNIPIDIDQLYSFRLPKQEAIDKYVSTKGYDPYLISRIQPQGGIHFRDDKYITTGTGYEACIHIYDYKISIDDYWLNTILNIENVISVVDIATENTEDAKKNLNKSMNEQDSRIESAKTRKEVLDASNRLSELQNLYEEINRYEEIIKLIHIRLFVSSTTKEELEKSVASIITKLQGKGFKGAVFLGEHKAEWDSMFQSYHEQEKNEYARYGQVVPSHNLAFGNPFIFSSLNDPYGIYMGTTKNSGGIFNFDPYAITNYRTHYNGVIAGVMGMGKSTTLKDLITIQFSLGTYIRGFDVKDEYGTLIKRLGGRMIYLDGSEGIINLLDILKTEETDYGSYVKQISKMRIIYKFFKKSASDNELSTFTDLLNKLYQKFNLRGDDSQPITGLDPEMYPTMSDLLDVINEEINCIDDSPHPVHQQLEIERKKLILNVQTTIKEVVESFGRIFDGHTSIKNIYNEQIVFFNISKLKDIDKGVFAAQIYNALTMCQENCIQLQTPMKNLYNKNEILWEDIHRYMIVIDESHRIVNAENDFALPSITNFAREARHLFAGIWFATQNSSDFVPEGSSEYGVKQLQTLFELCQYKFIMKQDSNTLPLLTKIFKEQMTASEVSEIPRFTKGEGILSIAGDKNVIVHIDVSDKRMAIFDGGA